LAPAAGVVEEDAVAGVSEQRRVAAVAVAVAAAAAAVDDDDRGAVARGDVPTRQRHIIAGAKADVFVRHGEDSDWRAELVRRPERGADRDDAIDEEKSCGDKRDEAVAPELSPAVSPAAAFAPGGWRARSMSFSARRNFQGTVFQVEVRSVACSSRGIRAVARHPTRV
jgi:hypothetical protein